MVHETIARGKHLLTRVEGGMTVHTHLRVDGMWRVTRAGPRCQPADEQRDIVRLILANDEWCAMGVRLGMVDLLPTAAEHRVVGHLGPDPLGPDWDSGEAAWRMARRTRATIGEALLDQRNMAGIGTIYRAETLFLAGISPWRPVAATGNLAGVASLARRLLQENKDRPTVVTTGDPRPGRALWVYGRAGRPCLRCGMPIEVGDLGGGENEYRERVIYWCPSCQAE